MSDCSNTDAVYLSEVSPTDKPWDAHRATASAVQKLYSEADLIRYAERIQKCSTLLGFGLESQDSGEFKLKLKQSRFCRVRHCPVCQWRRSMMWRARFLTALPKVIEAHPKDRWVFLTLTVRNCPLNELRATVGEMNRGWKRLTERKAWPAIGFVRSTEVTRGAGGSAHPHFHCLLLVKSTYFGSGYLKQADWVELWKQSARLDYEPIVDVRAVKGKGSDPQNSLIPALLETLKYGVKEADLVQSPEWLAGITGQLAKTRAVAVGGVLKEFLSDKEIDDLINAEDTVADNDLDDKIDLWFGWREMIKRYAKTLE